jgi:hypothetical protein
MTDKTCSRCGACCMVLPLFTQHMTPDYRKYLLNRGLQEDKEQGCILIPGPCQHLLISAGVSYEKEVYSCAIHNSPERPAVCGKFHGQKMVKGARFYIPPGCSYRED